MEDTRRKEQRIGVVAVGAVALGIVNAALLMLLAPSLGVRPHFESAITVAVTTIAGVLLYRAVRRSRQVQNLMSKREILFDKKERQFQALVQHGSDVIVVVTDEGLISFASPSVRQVFGIEPGSLIRASVESIVGELDRSRVRALFAMAARRAGVTMTAEWRAKRSDGAERQLEVLIQNLSEEEAIQGTVLNIRDVTDRKELQDQLSYQALHDHLTGLPNRALLQTSIETSLARWLFRGEVFSLLVIDLDDFKSINDSFGHMSGDLVLQELASRLKVTIRRGDTLVRLGGNEFAVLLAGVSAGDDEAVRVAERIIEEVQTPMDVEGRQLSLRASLGLACVSDQVSQPEDLLRNADLALHAAKVNKRGSWVQFEASMYEAAIHRAEMVSDLRKAIEADELQLYYQPTVDLDTGHFEGVEALLRWPHPERGFVSPADFIPVAEEAGLIVPIGTWVLRHACAQMAAWQARYPGSRPMILNVNLSGRQLAEPDVVELVASVLQDSGLIPGTLVLEMTESVLMDDRPETLAKMEALRELGVELAIDDFGTGYSSLSYLRQFPIGVLKIDRAFVNELGIDGKDGDTALVQAIVDLARTMNMRTVAEGIETPQQLDILRDMGCDIGQGFFLARPAPAEEIRRLIEKTVGANRTVPAAALPTNAQTVG